jgi:hypothetical protein
MLVVRIASPPRCGPIGPGQRRPLSPSSAPTVSIVPSLCDAQAMGNRLRSEYTRSTVGVQRSKPIRREKCKDWPLAVMPRSAPDGSQYDVLPNRPAASEALLACCGSVSKQLLGLWRSSCVLATQLCTKMPGQCGLGSESPGSTRLVRYAIRLEHARENLDRDRNDHFPLLSTLIVS